MPVMPYKTHDLPALKIELGPLYFEFRSLFWHSLKYKPRSITGYRMPLVERRPIVNEVEEPYRNGRAAVVRLWPTSWAVVFGYWKEIYSERSESEALVGVMDGERIQTPVTALNGWRRPLPEVEDDGSEVADPFAEFTVADHRESDITIEDPSTRHEWDHETGRDWESA